MTEFAQKPRAPRHTPAVSRRTAVQRPPLAGRSDAFLDTLQAALNESPRAKATARLQRAFNQSPRVAQFARPFGVIQTSGVKADAQRQAADDEELLQGRFETLQRVGGGDYDDYDGYDDYDSDEHDVDDPELAGYLRTPEQPTLWKFFTPEQQRKTINAEKRRRQLDKAARRKPKKDARTRTDAVEHARRRRLNVEAGALLEEVEGLEAGLSAACRNARQYVVALGDKKGRAGKWWSLIDAPKPAEEWDNRKQIINTLATGLGDAATLAVPVLTALTKLDHANLAVRTDALEAKISGMRTFMNDGAPHANTLEDLLAQAKVQVKWLDDLIAKGNPSAKKTDIQYPHVRIHKCIKKCPNYDNIPFDELEAQTATGTHGKSPRDAYVHKKVSGGCAITITYRGNISYVTDWGNKSPNSQKYDYSRGGTAYDSGATYDAPSEFFKV